MILAIYIIGFLFVFFGGITMRYEGMGTPGHHFGITLIASLFWPLWLPLMLIWVAIAASNER